MLDIEYLREQCEEASAYKEDLFDFYNRTWPKLIAEVERLRTEVARLNDNAVCRRRMVRKAVLDALDAIPTDGDE
jgi:hypothetical protein